jgi:HSP20 family protein
MQNTQMARQTCGNGRQFDTVFTPRVDVLETDNDLVLYADLPGVKPDDLDVQYEKGELTVRGRCPATAAPSFLQQEYGVGDFYRAFTITEDVDADKIAAELKHGVLTVRLPKAEAVKPRKIHITAH